MNTDWWLGGLLGGEIYPQITQMKADWLLGWFPRALPWAGMCRPFRAVGTARAGARGSQGGTGILPVVGGRQALAAVGLRR